MGNDAKWLDAEKCWVTGSSHFYNQELKRTGKPISAFRLSANTGCGEIAKLKELLASVHQISSAEWDDLDKAVEYLPPWFLNNSPPSLSDDEAKEWTAHWRTLEPHEQKQMVDESGWPALDWLYWLSPEMRIWYLVGMESNNCFIFVAPNGDFITGAARWMLQACGYEDIKEY